MYTFTCRKTNRFLPIFVRCTLPFFTTSIPSSLQHLLISDIHFSNYDKAVCLFCVYWPFNFHLFNFILLFIVLFASQLVILGVASMNLGSSRSEQGMFYSGCGGCPAGIPVGDLGFQLFLSGGCVSDSPHQPRLSWNGEAGLHSDNREERGRNQLCASFVKDSAKELSG